MRIAFFGGTFDPIHRGHIAIARAAAAAFQLQQVIFAPVGRQPLKTESPQAAYLHRLAMVQIACAEAGEAMPQLMPSSIDAPRPGGQPNYTADTLRELGRAMPEAVLYAIAGADSFLTLRQWHQPDVVLQLAQWIVVSRPGFGLTDLSAALHLTGAERARVHVLETVHEDVSASDLRRRLSAGDDCSDWLQPSVLGYIREHGLYAARPSAR